jgi:hypothetical protein
MTDKLIEARHNVWYTIGFNPHYLPWWGCNAVFGELHVHLTKAFHGEVCWRVYSRQINFYFDCNSAVNSWCNRAWSGWSKMLQLNKHLKQCYGASLTTSLIRKSCPYLSVLSNNIAATFYLLNLAQYCHGSMTDVAFSGYYRCIEWCWI